jgi:hypothetical protein
LTVARTCPPRQQLLEAHRVELKTFADERGRQRATHRICDEAKPDQILISPRVLTKVENAVKFEPVGEFELKGIRRPLAAYNVIAALSAH